MMDSEYITVDNYVNLFFPIIICRTLYSCSFAFKNIIVILINKGHF